MANYSLVLQNVRLNDAGYYSCQAENPVGATESNKLQLKIKCKTFFGFSEGDKCVVCILYVT